MTNFHDLRVEYKLEKLDEDSCDPNPFEQFTRWFKEAVAAKPPEPNAMALSSVGADGQPSSRMVLLKGFDANGFLFFTNYESRKGQELEINPKAALLFYWGELERQIRITGSVARTTREESERYFSQRPRNSQIGSYCSPQSAVISRADLEHRFAEASALCSSPNGANINCPLHWGGYRLVPIEFEFWQGRLNRLHDRIQYKLSGASWYLQRLAP